MCYNLIEKTKENYVKKHNINESFVKYIIIFKGVELSSYIQNSFCDIIIKTSISIIYINFYHNIKYRNLYKEFVW